MLLTYKYPLFAKKSQIAEFKRQCEIHKELYNVALKEKEKQYEKDKKSDSCFTQIKNIVPQYKERNCNYSSLQQTVRRLHKSYSAIYKKKGGKPRYCKNFSTISFGSHGDGWKLKGDSLYIQNIGNIKINLYKPINEPIHLNLKLINGILYACFTVEIFRESNSVNGQVGLDFGLKNFIVTSNNEKYDHPLPFKNKLSKFQKIQNKLSKIEDKKQKDKKYKILRKIHEKVRNQRLDFLHKLSRKIVNENKVIAVEDIDFKKLSRSEISNINRKYADVSCSTFYNFISYKAESAGRQFVKVNPAYTTQTCSNCGRLNELELKNREYVCKCGKCEDRDFNAAKNILNIGLEKVQNNIFALGLQSVVRA